MITIDRKVLEQALDALDRPRNAQSWYQRACDDAQAAKALREALAQPAAQQEPAGEPVAWDVYVAEHERGYLIDSLDDPQYLDDATNHGAVATPLYTHPAVPLTREAIQQAFEAWIKADSTLPVTKQRHGYTNFTVALQWHAWQAAHKIGGSE